jgi:hypothetical protein
MIRIKLQCDDADDDDDDDDDCAGLPQNTVCMGSGSSTRK